VKLNPKKSLSRRGRPRSIGGERLNFYPGKLRADMDALIEQARKLKMPKLTYSYILRNGARLFISKTSAEFNKALSGKLHAKWRD
jgi:hypothetical protein